jgi:hypothetical protein
MPKSKRKQRGIVQDERAQEQPASPEDARRGSATTRDKLANMGGDGLTELDPPSNSDTAERLCRMKDPDSRRQIITISATLWVS